MILQAFCVLFCKNFSCKIDKSAPLDISPIAKPCYNKAILLWANCQLFTKFSPHQMRHSQSPSTAITGNLA
ncbi:hypothetical protein B0181_06845 [Moraxella caviae]|uniref:Uncharacterized protein n=1 Tax=Moraxella caviae TaxID=34060 RepID=A0A1T0A0T6_9GAMM|nr:hypothetical protein B0181_06845 [Moraxella caviae]